VHFIDDSGSNESQIPKILSQDLRKRASLPCRINCQLCSPKIAEKCCTEGDKRSTEAEEGSTDLEKRCTEGDK